MLDVASGYASASRSSCARPRLGLLRLATLNASGWRHQCDRRLDPVARRREERLVDVRRPRAFVSPDRRRCLLTVRAAISFARPPPRFWIERLMCSYCRFRFGLFTPFGGIALPSSDGNVRSGRSSRRAR